jgi:hypothetical protein
VPNPDQLPTIAGPSKRSRKDPGYSRVAYELAGGPRSVFCWDQADWDAISGDSPNSEYVTYGFVDSDSVHQINLAPSVCKGLDVLRYRHLRPPPALSIASDVVTLSHEMLHTIGFENEARTECGAIQLTALTSHLLGTSWAYGRALAEAYWQRGYNLNYEGPDYYSKRFCVNGGRYDLFPNDPGWPSPTNYG